MEGPFKERLTGALIFVAALVVIVPEMLMLSRPDTEATTTVVTPAQQADAGAPLRTHTVKINAAPSQPSAAESVVAMPTVVPPAPAPAPVPVPPEPMPAETPAAMPVVSVSQSTARWWAQLGSFSAPANATKLAQKLRAAGYVVDVAKISAGGKELYRVRAGPAPSRAEALTLQLRLEAAGHKSTLVAP